jgi:cation diffusion facilitator family transporter
MNQTEKASLIRTASYIALFGNAALAALKIAVGLSAGSLAVVGDGIDSSTDVIIALGSLIVAGVIARPADAEHPWGHGRAETIATTVLAFILFFAGAQLILNAAGALLRGESTAPPSLPSLLVTGVSIAGKLALAYSQHLLGKKAASAMLAANAKNMAGDVVLSGGVLAGLGLSILLGVGFIDGLVAVGVGLWVVRSALGIFLETNMELMDGSSDTALYAAVFDAVRSVPGTGNPHRTRMRRIAGLWDIDIDIEVDPGLTVREAHRIACLVEQAIKKTVEGVYDIMVHVEPAGESAAHAREQFGLSEEAMRQI